MMDQYERTARVLGQTAVETLKKSSVILFGVGGVGSYAAEALVRAGVGKLTIVDRDVVDETNINRQLIALHSTIGMSKVDVAAARYKDIDPTCEIIPLNMDVTVENIHQFDFTQYDYVMDAIDTVSAKIAIIEAARNANVPVITSMGTGNTLDSTGFTVDFVEKTSVCPLARVMRRELKNRNIKGVKAVYSKEIPTMKAVPPGSVSFVPGAAGLVMAGEAVKTLIEN